MLELLRLRGARCVLLLLVCALTPCLQSAIAADADHPGGRVYERSCAACHDHPEQTRAPTLQALKGMRYQAIHFALTAGKMQVQAKSLTPVERASVVDFLVGRAPPEDQWIAKMMCAADARVVDLRPAPTVAGFGFNRENHRHLTREQAGLATADFPNLELAWALAIPHATTLRAQAAVVGSTLFLPLAESPQLVAMDVSGPPCFKWVYQTDVPLRTGVAFGTLPGSGRKVLAFADAATYVHVIDAATGKLIWRTRAGMWGLSNTTGTPAIYGNRVYMPLSASEINVGADLSHECCKTHGAVIAFDAATGRKVWTAHTMEDAKPIRDRGDGKMMWDLPARPSGTRLPSTRSAACSTSARARPPRHRPRTRPIRFSPSI
ncbi:MAG: PQQ-binding-like beta-propeller repeat protein [Gammaproteobacteria bacterium]